MRKKRELNRMEEYKGKIYLNDDMTPLQRSTLWQVREQRRMEAANTAQPPHPDANPQNSIPTSSQTVDGNEAGGMDTRSSRDGSPFYYGVKRKNVR